MASINELMGNEPTSIDQLIDINTGTNDPLPPSQNRNRAAISALQTGNPVENFQTFQADKAVGSEQTLQEVNSQAQQANAEGDFNALVNTMADPNIPMEQKQAAVDGFSSSSFLSDPEVNLATAALTAESEGMTPDQDAVRVSTADALADYREKKGERQALINAFIQDNNSTTGIARSFEWLRVFTPGNEAAESVAFQSAAAERMGEGSRGVVKTIKDMILTGQSTQEFREKFENMDDYSKTQMLQDLLNAVKENDGILFNENQVAAVNMANRYLQGEYTDGEAIFDSAMNILDLLGVGFALKGSWKALTAGRRVGEAGRAAQAAETELQIAQGIRRSAPPSDTSPLNNVPDSAFNGDLEQSLDNVFSSSSSPDSVELSGRGFTKDEMDALERAGLATNGRMTVSQWAAWTDERGRRLSSPRRQPQKPVRSFEEASDIGYESLPESANKMLGDWISGGNLLKRARAAAEALWYGKGTGNAADVADVKAIYDAGEESRAAFARSADADGNVTLYRGVRKGETERAPNAIESYTTDRNVAKRFADEGGEVREVKVKVEDIIFHYGEAEGEVLVRRAGASRGAPSTNLARTLPEAQIPANTKALQAAQAEHQGLLAQSGNLLDRGSVRSLQDELNQVNAQLKTISDSSIKTRAKDLQGGGLSYKEALSSAKKEAADLRVELDGRKTAIDNRLQMNAQAQQAANRIPEVERRIEAISGDKSTIPARLNPIMDAISRIEMNSVVAPYNPSAAANVLGYFNPSKGRNAFKALYNSPGDDLSLAGYGVSKQDAIVSQIMPQMATESNKVAAKVVDVERAMNTDFPYDEGGIRFTAKEQDNMAAGVLNKMKDVKGLTPHDAESSFRVSIDGGQLDIRAMYGTSEGGFLTAEDAVRQARHALRDIGVVDSDITIMKRDGVDYVPVDPASVRGVEGDYKVQISKKIDQSMELMGDGWEHFDVKKNFFDRFPSLQFSGSGTVNRMLVDAASNLHPAISGSLAAAVDRGSRLDKLLLKQADVFAKQYVKFPKDRQKKVWEYLLEANRDGLPHNVAELKARGFADTEIDAMKDFRNFWDTHWKLENLDRVRTYRAEGYQVLETKLGDRYFARPVAKNTNNRVNVFDTATDSVRDLSQAELDDLYNQGGTLAAFKEATDFGGTSATHMIVRNTPDEYLRTLNDTDKVLNYREGYFQIQYKNARFIDEVRPDGTTRAVAVAGDTPSAEAEIARLKQINGKEYKHRADERGIKREGDAYWSVNSVSGRIAQRRRGKLLEGADGLNHLDYTFIENPIDSAIRAARSISGRTTTRQAIETAKARAMKQYGHMLKPDAMGNTPYPNDIKNLAVKGEYTSKELADARTTFEYINRMENGYINTIDETTKAVLNWLGDGLGGYGLGAAERGARAVADMGVTGAMRATAFQAYIALNPIRNWIMQPIQVARTLAYNPIDWANGKIPGYMASAVKYKMGGKMTAEESRFVKALQDTGMLDGVDRSSLVRGAMLQATERSNSLVKGLSWLTEMSRKIGFDLGEKFNLIGHYAAVYSKYERKGADLTNSRVLAEIQSEARAISGEMNKAGDLAYTQNWMSVPLQFAQVPHKFVLGMTNRRIPLDARRRMAAGDLVMWGIPGTYILTEKFGDKMLPSDPEWRDFVVSGAAAFIVNKVAQAAGDDTRIDFESLAPYNLGGFGDLAEKVWSEGLGNILESTPSGQLLFKDAGRFGTAARTLFRYLSPSEEGLQSDEDFMDVLNAVAKISSQWNNITKAYMAYQTKMYLDKKGLPIDKNVTTTEAIAMAFGFAPKEVGEFYDTRQRLYDRRESAENTARELATGIVETAMNSSDDKRFDSAEMVSKRSSALMFLAKQDPAMARMVDQELSKMLKDPELQIKKALIESSGLINPDEVVSIIRGSPLPDQEKKNAEDFITNLKQASENFNQRGE